MRILFHGPGLAAHRQEVGLPLVLGVQAGTAQTLAELRQTHQLTGNRGNIIHAEAPVKCIAHDPRRSVYGNIATMRKALGSAYREIMAQHFDMIVVSMANFIRPDHDGAVLAAALVALDGAVPFIILGAGLQGSHPLSAMKAGNRDLLAVMNERAALFGVRGAKTAEWLTTNGFGRATIMGCPSLFAYPSSILSIDATQARAKGRRADVMTAGHLTVRQGQIVPRGLYLAHAFKPSIFRKIRASYVFQDEFFSYDGAPTFAYDEGSQSSPAAPINAWLSSISGKTIDFERYYYFTEAAAWRQAALRHDVYIGDRFHAGIAAMQAGLPAIFLSEDNRVSELTDHFALPAMTIKDFSWKGVRSAVRDSLSEDALSRMKAVYRQRFKEFSNLMARHGLQMQTRIDGATEQPSKPSPLPPAIVTTEPRGDAPPVSPEIEVIGEYRLRRLCPPGARELVISFEAADPTINRKDPMRRGFGEAFLLEQGYAVLSVLTSRTNWYRPPGLRERFSAPEFQSWLRGFDAVHSYGSSMGGHAACLFAGLLGCKSVVALQPISTLAADLVPWETRFNYGRSLDWSGPHRDAVDGLGDTAIVYALFDPQNDDARHIRRFTDSAPGQVRLVPIPGAEHAVPRYLAGKGLLKTVVSMCLQGKQPVEIARRLQT